MARSGAQRSADWRARHPERKSGAQRTADWRARHPERAKVSSRRWRLDHPVEAAAATARWRAENPERAEQIRVKGVLKRKGSTQQQYDDLLVEQNGGCAICGKKDDGRR